MLAQINSSWHFKNTLKSFRGLQFKDPKTSNRHIRDEVAGGRDTTVQCCKRMQAYVSRNDDRSVTQSTEKSSVMKTDGALLCQFVSVLQHNVTFIYLFDQCHV